MADNKTHPTPVSAESYVAALPDARRREEADKLDALLRRVTGESPRMWGPSIIGYGSYHYRYASGREGDAPRIGFSPRKGKHVLYLAGEFGDLQAQADALLAKLGKHGVGVACLYVKTLADIDLAVLEDLAALSCHAIDARYPK